MCLTCNSLVVLTRDKALRSAAVAEAAAAGVACYISPFARDFTAVLAHLGPILIGDDQAADIAEHASMHLIGWSGGLFLDNIDRIALITTTDVGDPYIQDLCGLIHAHKAIRVPLSDEADERYLRAWIAQVPPF